MQTSGLPRVLASFPVSQGLLLAAELLGRCRLCLPELFKPILREKEGWGQWLCVGGFLLCRWVPGGPGHRGANGAACVSKEGEEVRAQEHSLSWRGASLIIHHTDIIQS